MVRQFVRQARILAFGSAAFVAAAVQAATLVSVPLPVTLPLQIIGADNCVSWTAGGTATAPTLTCNTTTIAPPPPESNVPVCSLTANGFSALTLTAAGSVTLAASCTNSPTSYTWTGVTGPVAGASQTVQVGATTTFGVTATNASGTSSPASVTVTVNIAAAPPPTASFCSQYPNVQPTIVAPWGTGGSWTTGASGGFPYNGVLVFQITVPAGTPASIIAGKFAVSEFQGLPTMRQATISKSACDFRTPDYKGDNGPLTWSNGTTATTSFAVVPPEQVGLTGAVAGLVAGQTYFINVRNFSIDLNGISCPTNSTCNAIVNEQPAFP
jgi:hypothetical protein